jgi:serine/threonine protein kinase
MINTTIGKYKLIRLIGEGGMASVYEAEHEMLGTKVAIKVLNPILSANIQIRERFKNEAKMMASFNHPNITKIIDFDDQPHQLSIVMEFLEGEDLNEKIKRSGPLSQEAIKDIFIQTLSAFQYAHEKGVVHRDIKPSNIYVLPNGHVKILDFGIAKLFGQGNEMTQTGAQMGTPVYMSPEQVKADKSIDHRSDIYSLGVTMYFAITGKPPYNSDTTSQFDIFNKIVFEPLEELPYVGDYDDFVKKACQKNRDQRFQSCEEWIDLLNSKESTISSFEDKSISETLPKLSGKDLNPPNSTPQVQTGFQNAATPMPNKGKSKLALILSLVFGSLLLISGGLYFFLEYGPILLNTVREQPREAKATLYQAAFNGEVYEYNFLPKISVSGAPDDIDWNRWSVLHDGDVHRLYFFPKKRSDILYQFGFNKSTSKYEFGYSSVSEIPIQDLPEGTNISNFSILFDGLSYRLYFRSKGNRSLYQCSYDEKKQTYRYGFKSIPEIKIIGAPEDTEWNSWSMLYDGSSYRLYVKSSERMNVLYQFSFDGYAYVYGYNSIPEITVKNMPKLNYVKKFNITHDGGDYRFYNLLVE